MIPGEILYPLLGIIFLLISYYLGLFSYLLEIPESLEEFIEHFVEFRLGYLQLLSLLITLANIIFLYDSQSTGDSWFANLLVAIAIPAIGFFNILLAFKVGHDTNPNSKWDDWIGRIISLSIAIFIVYIIHSIMFMKYGLANSWGQCSLLFWKDDNIFKLYSNLGYSNTIKFCGVLCENLIAVIIAITPFRDHSKPNTKINKSNTEKDKGDDSKNDKPSKEDKEDKNSAPNKKDPPKNDGKKTTVAQVFPNKPDFKNLKSDERKIWIDFFSYIRELNDNKKYPTEEDRIKEAINKSKELNIYNEKYLKKA